LAMDGREQCHAGTTSQSTKKSVSYDYERFFLLVAVFGCFEKFHRAEFLGILTFKPALYSLDPAAFNTSATFC
jgi:hypothetical protein